MDLYKASHFKTIFTTTLIMYVLSTPPVHRPLENSVSLTGVTCLKDGYYSKRYIGSKKIVISPNSKIEYALLKKPTETKTKRPKAKVSGILAQDLNNSGITDCSIRVRNSDNRYSVKKSLVRQRLLTFIASQSGTKQLYFFTVTFPLNTSDDNAYRFYNNWLSQLRNSGLLRSYLWVAERQQNGTIHYHIAITHRMNVTHANKVMVTILTNAVRNGTLNWNLQAAKRYNGVDIAKNRKTNRVTNFAVRKGKKSLISYLTKYVTKNDVKFKHYAWHCSRDFSNLIIKVSFTKEEALTCGFELYINDEQMYETEHCIFFPWRDYPPPEVLKHIIEINRLVTTFYSEVTYLN